MYSSKQTKMLPYPMEVIHMVLRLGEGGVNMEGEAGIVRSVNLVEDEHAGIHHPRSQAGVLIEALLDRVALGQRAADAADKLAQMMPSTI